MDLWTLHTMMCMVIRYKKRLRWQLRTSVSAMIQINGESKTISNCKCTVKGKNV
jgi:hypothetical protein